MGEWKVTIAMSDGKVYDTRYETRTEAVNTLKEIDRCMEKGCMYWLDGFFEDRRLLNPRQMMSVRMQREL